MKHSPFEMSASAAEVIGKRLPVMWMGMLNPTASSQAEMLRMVVEKQMAFAEACFGMTVEMTLMMMTPFAGTERLMEAALGPSARRVKANVRRLRR